MSKVYASFLGYQLDPRENCYTPWFTLHVTDDYEGDLRPWNNSNVSLQTLNKFGIDVPKIPKYIPSQFFGNTSVVYNCSECLKSFGLDKIQALEHIKNTKHAPISEEVTIEEQKQEYNDPSYSTSSEAISYNSNDNKYKKDITDYSQTDTQVDPLLEKHKNKRQEYAVSKEKTPDQAISDFRKALSAQFPDLPFLKENK